MSEILSIRFDFLDHQIVDADARPFARIDDLDVVEVEGEPPVVASLLVGVQALGERLGGLAGNWAVRTASRLRERSDPDEAVRIDANLIRKVHPLVELRVPLRELPQAAPLERWLARHFVERFPHSGDARD